MTRTLLSLYELWDTLRDVPVREDKHSRLLLDADFSDNGGEVLFARGEDVEEIWHWFEEQHEQFVVGEVMEGRRRWATGWPSKTGTYWLYGWVWDREKAFRPRMYFVEVNRISNGVVAITQGNFLYQSDVTEGYWLRAATPAPPYLGDGNAHG